MKKRNINIDLIKSIAVFLVISVHFFLNTKFYNMKVTEINMFIGIFFRTMFMICVPLFMITTGYLMKDKKLNKKYYIGIFRVLITYLLSSITILTYLKIYNNEPFDINYILEKILTFSCGYSWYIEMYIGLFLLIPFINLIYNNLKSKKQKQLLILTMLILTSFQGILNIKYIIIPDWWINLYPLTYYFIGCYLKEYKININKYVNILLFFSLIVLSSYINIIFSKGDHFKNEIYNNRGSIFNVLSAVLFFIFIINLNLNKMPKVISKIITKLSNLSLGIYLLSVIPDNLLYFHIFKDTNLYSFKGYFTIIPLVFILSIVLSIIINVIYKLIDKFIIQKILKKIIVD